MPSTAGPPSASGREESRAGDRGGDGGAEGARAAGGGASCRVAHA